MSTSSSPRPPAQATRQLLDELDALMKRMLALPVNQLEEELQAQPKEAPLANPESPSPPRPALTLELPDPAAALSLPADKLTEDETQTPQESSLSSDALAADPVEPAERAESCALAREEELPRAASNWERELPASPEVLAALGIAPPPEDVPVPLSAGVRTAAVAAPTASTTLPMPVAGWLGPLVWTNRVFDFCTGWMGGPGQWLRSRHGRTLLGWIGLGLLTGALVWVLSIEIGWTW